MEKFYENIYYIFQLSKNYSFTREILIKFFKEKKNVFSMNTEPEISKFTYLETCKICSLQFLWLRALTCYSLNAHVSLNSKQ